MKIASLILALKPGDIIEADADCDTFESDVRGVCTRWKKVILGVKMKSKTVKTIMIQI
jgi:TusA-related sulfurtransferase